MKMNEHFLSRLHIEKLGHPLEEIRIRALSSVISKYNLHLVDENNVENTKCLLKRLLDWFTFDEYKEEKKVLQLLQRILNSENGKRVITEMGTSKFLMKLSDLDQKTRQKHSGELNDIKLCLAGIDEDFSKDINYSHSRNLHTNDKKLILYNTDESDNACDSHAKMKLNLLHEENEKCQSLKMISNKCDKLIINGVDLKTLKISQDKVDSFSNSCFKLEYFPWQNLTPNDKQVLSSVFDGLKYIDDKCSILQSCVFYNEVVLRDFPPEIFIQRPLILRTFLQLLKSVETDFKVPIIKCLIQTVLCLKTKVQLTLNSSVYNREKRYNTNNVYPDDDSSESDEKKSLGNFYLNYSQQNDDNVFCNGGGGPNEDYKLKKYQLALPEFCFEVLMSVLPLLKNKESTQEEINNAVELCWECLMCLMTNLKPDVWEYMNGLKDKFYKMFCVIQELIKIFRKTNPPIYLILLNFVTKILHSLKPPSDMDLCDVIPKGLQLELGNCMFHSTLYLMFPRLHAQICKYVKGFVGQRERELYQDYKEVQTILNSMKSCVTFTRARNTLKKKIEKLETAYEALQSLCLHENYQFIRSFVSCCLLKWNRSQLDESEANIREKILLKLLSHGNDNVKTFAYGEINDVVVGLLGEKEAVQPSYEFPGDKIEFLFSVDVLTEIICHGINSELNKVSECSNNILVYLLRSKFLMSETCWTDFIGALSFCLGLLECFADKSTLLGRCIIKMFDPDVAGTTGLPQIELIKGNIRLLFAKNSLTREEAVSRLFWLLNREDVADKKLPRMSVLTKLNLSPICVSAKPEEYSTLQRSFYDPGKVCDVLEMLATQKLEPSVRKSALSQLSLMVEDVLLHSTFLEQKGLRIMLNILDNSLVEGNYEHHPDSVIPVIDILKQMALHNAFVCQELGSQTKVFYNVLRSLFLFSNDERFRRNAVQLLWLLLYSDCTLRVPSDKSSGRMLSFPDLVVSKMVLPFVSQIHWKKSKHFESCLKKALLGKENSSKLIRIFYAAEWAGSLSELLAMKETDLEEKTCSPGLPNEMKVSYEDIGELRECSFSISTKQLLCDIQNASTHEAVFLSIHKLQNYLLLYNVDKMSRSEKESEVTNENVLSHMLWESTLERFMLSPPTCSKDESLLSLVAQFVQTLLKSFKSERLLNWIEKNLINIHQPLYRSFKCLAKQQSGLKGRDLRLSVIQLAQQVIISKASIDSVKWFPYLDLISNLLKLDKKGNEFYNVAYVDWFIALLVHLTRKSSFSSNPDKLKHLIVRLLEIVIAFHCTPDSAASFMGLNIVKNSIFTLNHILFDIQNNIVGWEQLWFEAFSRVIGHSDNLNYCWLMSLWFVRDPIVRAASLQLFVGFSTTPKSCQLLLDRLNVPVQLVWTEGFKILVNEKESCCVREKCGLLLSNLLSHAHKLFTGNFVENLNRLGFYEKTLEIVENYQSDWNYQELVFDDASNTYRGEVFTRPALITAVSILVQNVLSLDPENACQKLVDMGMLECLTRVLGEVPDSVVDCEKHQQCVDVMKMYITVCKLLTTCILSNSTAHAFLLQSHNTINSLFSMINYNLYCGTSPTITSLKIELWTQVLNLFSALLLDDSKNSGGQGDENSAFLALNRCMTENGVDNFTSSLYIALTSDSPALRFSTLVFLTNLFHHEIAMRKNVSMSDIFERKISDEAVESAKLHGSKELDVPKNLTLEFGIRIADILLGSFLLSIDGEVDSTKIGPSAKALGGLFAVYRPAQDFCLRNNFPGFIVLHLKKICVKLSLENPAGLKKLSEKKKVHPLLQSVEILCQLMSNFMHENDAVRADAVKHGFSVIIHKLWPWVVMKPSLHETILKTLCTFTRSFSPGCRSLVLSSNFAVMSLKKMPGSMTLINAIVNEITVEMESSSSQPRIVCVCLQLLSNCCDVTECRSVISKGNILQSFLKVQSGRKKKVQSDEVVESWLKFLVVFSSHQEGQLALTKNQDVLDLILKMAATGPKFSIRMDGMIALRNVCFHQLNRYRMLNWCEFLTLLQDAVTSGRRTEIVHAANAVWALACNSQKDKVILRNAGFEARFETAKRHAVASEDAEMEELLNVVIGILRNK